jgi:hypothetical protein
MYNSRQRAPSSIGGQLSMPDGRALRQELWPGSGGEMTQD